MKAAVLEEINHPLVLKNVEISPLRVGQVLVKVIVSGICGSQLHEINGNKGNSNRVTKQERALRETVFDLSNKLANSERLYETTKESHRIVLETKESVVRSLLKQNTEISFERDSLSARVESLTSALDHLTGLLRNLQSSSMTNNGAPVGIHSNKVVTIGGVSDDDIDVTSAGDAVKKVVISGGGGEDLL